MSKTEGRQQGRPLGNRWEWGAGEKSKFSGNTGILHLAEPLHGKNPGRPVCGLLVCGLSCQLVGSELAHSADMLGCSGSGARAVTQGCVTGGPKLA